MVMLHFKMKHYLISVAVKPFSLLRIFLPTIGFTINMCCQQDSFHLLRLQKQFPTFKFRISQHFITNLVRLLIKPMLEIQSLTHFNPVCLLDRNQQPLTIQVTMTHYFLKLL